MNPKYALLAGYLDWPQHPQTVQTRLLFSAFQFVEFLPEYKQLVSDVAQPSNIHPELDILPQCQRTIFIELYVHLSGAVERFHFRCYCLT